MASSYAPAAFNSKNTALILVDHQVGTINWAGELSPAEREELKLWVRLMARFAKGAGVPIVLTSSLETEAQGPLLPEFSTLMPDEFAARIRRTGVINAWEDPAFAAAVQGAGRPNLLMSGLTTDVCLVPPAISAKDEGFNIIALIDQCGACTKSAAANARALLAGAGIPIMTTLPMITAMLGNYRNPESAAFFKACADENMFDLLGRGGVR